MKRHFFFSPVNQKIFRVFLLLAFSPNVFAQSNTINSATFGMLEARWLGPGTMSGRITDIQGVNADGKTIYIGTAGGGIWKTTNAGASFKPVFDKHCQSIGALAIDQKNPKIVFAGTGESNMRNSVSIGNGLYKTTDAGDNWIKIGLDSTEHIAKVMIDPSNSSTVYVAAPAPCGAIANIVAYTKAPTAVPPGQKFYTSTKKQAAPILKLILLILILFMHLPGSSAVRLILLTPAVMAAGYIKAPMAAQHGRN
jgi:hypothetical protein